MIGSIYLLYPGQPHPIYLSNESSDINAYSFNVEKNDYTVTFSNFFYSYPIFNVIWTYSLLQYVFLIQWKFLAVNVLIEGLSLNIPIDVVSL